MTHTPGPWEVVKGASYKIIAENGMTVCETQRINARLIAAAPELLEELEKSDDLIAMLIAHFVSTASSKVFGEQIQHIEERREARKALFNKINPRN